MALANRSAWKQRTQLFTWTLMLIAGMVFAATNCHAYQDSARRPIPVQNLPRRMAKAPATQDWMADLKEESRVIVRDWQADRQNATGSPPAGASKTITSNTPPLYLVPKPNHNPKTPGTQIEKPHLSQFNLIDYQFSQYGR